MIRAATAIFLVAFGGVCLRADDRKEPPLKYTLEIDGRRHELLLDKPTRLHGTLNEPTVTLRASPVRHFTYGDVRFQYPASFGWEAEIESPDQKIWTLSGNDFKIMYFVQPVSLPTRDYVEAMAEQIVGRSVPVKDVERTLGGRTYEGSVVTVALAGTRLSIEAITLPTEVGSRLLVFQDSPPTDKPRSNEAEAAFRLLAKSFHDMTKPEKPSDK